MEFYSLCVGGPLTFKTDFAGRVKVCEAAYSGSILQVSVQVPHIFRKLSCTSHVELSRTRLSYFVEKVN